MIWVVGEKVEGLMVGGASSARADSHTVSGWYAGCRALRLRSHLRWGAGGCETVFGNADKGCVRLRSFAGSRFAVGAVRFGSVVCARGLVF